MVSGCICKGAEMEHLAASYPKAPGERCGSHLLAKCLALGSRQASTPAPVHSPGTALVLKFLSMKTGKQYLLKCAIY